MTAGQAHEGDAVAVGRVHVGLDLEHHAGELGLFRVHHALHGWPVARGRRQIDQGVQHLAHAEVVHRRAEEHGRLAPGQEFFFVESGGCTGHQLQFLFGLFKIAAEALHALGVVQADQRFFLAAAAVFAGAEHAHLVGAAVEHAAEGLAHAHRPGERHHGHAQFSLDLVHQVQRGLHLAVHLVDESQDGRVARAANLQQTPGLGLHAIARIDHHQGRVHGRQHAVGVFREVLVTGCVQQVDHAVAVFHLHHRRGHRNATLLLDFHPVRGRMARRFAGLYAAGDVDCAREQQELFRERGLTRVGVGNDGEGAPAAHLFGNFGHSP